MGERVAPGRTAPAGPPATFARAAAPTDDAGPGPAPDRRDEIAIHIFTVSATLVGACLTVVGLLRHLGRGHPVPTVADDLLTADAFLLVVVCILAYAALRTPDRARRARREQWADGLFLCALGVMATACALVTYLVF